MWFESAGREIVNYRNFPACNFKPHRQELVDHPTWDNKRLLTTLLRWAVSRNQLTQVAS
jgi:hypothetical protein